MAATPTAESEEPGSFRGTVKKVVFSSDDLPPGLDDDARFRLWQNVFADTVGSFDTSRLPDRPFFARSELLQFGEVILGRFTGTTRELCRTRQQVVANPSEYYGFAFNTGTAPVVRTQRDDEHLLATGDVSFQCYFEAITISANAPNEWVAVMVRRDAVRALVPAADDLVVAPFDRSSPTLRHLRGYIGSLLDVDGLDEDPALLDHVGTSLVDLVALALGAKGDAAAIAHMRGERAARARMILAELKAGFSDPAFSPGTVAAKLGLTTSYIQKLLHETGLSFTERIIELRLQKARAMLVDPRHQGKRIGEIAYICGFNEVSYFNRCFRRRFGESPTQHRGGVEAKD